MGYNKEVNKGENLMFMNKLGQIMVYLVEVYNLANGEVVDLADDMYIAYPREQKVSYDELIEWFQGDLIDKRVEIYQARCGSFSVIFDRDGNLELDDQDVDCSTGYNGSPIDWRDYDGDGCCGEEIPYEE